MQSIDEIPVGSSKAGAPSEMNEEFATQASSAADTTGPLEQRLVSKSWSVRATAFEELTQLFKGAQSPKDDVFSEHGPLWKKYLSEINPGALEKCLEALQAFVDFGDPKVVVMSQNDVIKLLIEKCIGHTKPSIKQKGLECFNLLFEVTESFDESVETITESLNAKNIKTSSSAMVALNSWVSNFGAKKVKLKPFMKIAETNANSSNPQIRQEAMNFYKECYKFLGEDLKPLLKELKKQQLDDLDKAFEELKGQPKNIRLTRTEKKKQKDAKLDEIIRQEEEEKQTSSAAFDLADEVDILAKFNPEWQDKILEMKKWNEKKDQLEQLINDSNVPKLKAGDYSGLVKVLKKLISDANQVVSQLAIKACGNLAKGLRNEFESQTKELIGALIQKFKEKKTQIIQEVHTVLESFIDCTTLEHLSADLAAGVADKAPTVKKNTCQFLEKYIQQTYIDVLQRSSQELIQVLMKSSDDQAGDVRDAALQVLGIMKGRLGDASMSKYLSDLNPQKLAKVNEAAQQVQPSKYDRPMKQPEKKPLAKTAPPAKKAPVKKAVGKKEEKKQEEEEEEEQAMEIDQQNDRPIAKGGFDDMPIGGGNKGGFDDMPVGGGNKGGFDEMPIGGGNKGGFDDMPIGGKSGYNLDDLDMMDQSMGPSKDPTAMNFGSERPPKSGPPARLAQRNKKNLEEEKVPKDEEESVQQKPADNPPPSAPPKRVVKEKTETKTTTAPKAAAKGGAKPEEDDQGGGLSKEEAEAKMYETFNNAYVAKLEEAKWQDKVEGFKGIGEQIIELQPPADVIEALAKFTKVKLKDWKESNINLIKEALALFMLVAQNCEKVNRRAVSCIMPFLSDKLGDVKVLQTVQELLMALSELVTPKYIAMQVIKYASNAKSPKVLQESCNILTTMTDEFGVTSMPLKEMIEYAKLGANHSNAQVRTASLALFAMMYKHVGDTIKGFLTEIKESTMKVLEEEFKKVTPLKKGEFQNKRGLRGEAAAELQADPKKGGGGGLDDLLPREDISKQITPKLLAMFKNQNWVTRKEAADKIEEILKAAKMRIKPDGLNELMDNMKQRMVDPNKSVLKSYIQLLGILVEALGPAAKQFAKKVLVPMMQNLADKQSLVRADCMTCIEKWAEQIGPESVINYLGPLIIQENPELRTEALQWIQKQSSFIKQSETKELVKPLVACLSDKVPSIRQMTEAIICEVMPVTGYSPFQGVLTDLKPAVQNTIKPILEKVKQKVGANMVSAPVENLNASINPKQAQANNKTINKKEEQKDQNNSSLKGPLKKTLGSTTTVVPPKEEAPPQQKPQSTFQEATLKRKQVPEKQTPQAKNRSESKDAAKVRGISSAQSQTSQFQQEQIQEQSSGGFNVIFGQKDKRAVVDQKNKWGFDEIKADQIEKLKVQIQQIFGANLQTKLFSNDFKQHNECIDVFAQFFETQPDQFKEILDLIFKWSVLKMGETSNTQFAIKLFDFYHNVFQQFEEEQYMLQDFESLIVFPLLCDKSGMNNALLKDKAKKLIRMVYNVYDKHRCYQMLIQYGLNSKNMRTQAECLDEMADFIKNFGIDFCTEKDIKLVSKMADYSDKGVRENAVKVMAEVYKYMGTNIWRVIGEVTPKVQGLFEQRFKKMQLGSSSSSANIFQPIQSDQERQSPRNTVPAKSQVGFGLKKQASQLMDNKKATTPRNIMTFNKVGDQKGAKQAENNLSKSINQFNMSNGGEEQKKTPVNIPKKSDFLKKTNTDDHNQSALGMGKRLIPNSQRLDSSLNPAQDLVRGSSETQAVQKSQFQSKLGGSSIPPLQKSLGGLRGSSAGGFQSQDEEMPDTSHLEVLDGEILRQQDEIEKHIHQLKYGDLSKRVDSLVSLNELITQIEANKPALVHTANDLINAFTHVLMDIFDRPVEEIPLRFAKYFITIVLKACSCKEIMREVSEERIFELAEQLLTRLLIENLDKVGENKEGELILKNLNSSMLRLLENCNHTYIFCVLFNLLRKYKDFHQLPKLPGLIIKCLLKLSKILEKLIEKLDMEKILLAIHEYLVVVNHENKTQNDEMGIRIVKTVINELVKLKRENIMEAYSVIQQHPQPDNHIYRWIQIILKSLQTGQGTIPGNSGQHSQSMTTNQSEQEIKQIVEELRNSDQFETALPKLYNFLESNPQVDLNEYLQDCSKTFQQFIKQNLEKYRAQMKNEECKETEQLGMMDSMKSTTHSDGSRGNQNANDNDKNQMNSSGKISEYQNKLAGIKQRFNPKSGADTGTNKEQAQHNLNTSFSALNTSLSQRWQQINNKTAQKSSGTTTATQQLSNTMGGFKEMSSNAMVSRTSHMNQSSGGAQSDSDQQNTQGATNQDLNKRLAEMKAKLQALKRTRE